MNGPARVCVFCGSSRGKGDRFAQAAEGLGRLLAAHGLGLVYGGGHIGLMGILADAALEAGGEVIGVIPQALLDRELGHPGLTELRVVQTMHERKALMNRLSGAFIALPGGYGTLDELCEVLTWAQLGIHHKPCVLLNVGEFFDRLLSLFDHQVEEGFLAEEHRRLLRVETDPSALVEALAAELGCSGQTDLPESAG